ncbi:YihY/virulence factor BrkB family protein [Pleomorphovibrio marinus]|uniref:YihY/virulence factor BrkB family protein n=1 Tax=Pleomorphovibrio marinus TaxID=2164132 RepID=UPI000E0B0863|nr:YihY/virulence factor BrkB family protein [Pleomorphovibrio marinus]
MGKFKFSHLKPLLASTTKRWLGAEPFRQSALISYYAIFSIPGLLIIIIWAAGVFFGEEAVQGEITQQIGGAMGPDAAQSLESIVYSAHISTSSWVMKIVGIGALVFGATTLFFQLQKSLNYLWDVEPDPDNNLKKFILDRASSLGLILVIAFLLLISLLLSSALAILSDWITGNFGDSAYFMMEGFDFILSFVVISLLFALMFKFLPDVEIQWKSVWVGALATALLFTIGKTLLGIYFGMADPTSGFGAAGTVILIMVWVNYTSLILFFGAEFTHEYAHFYGHSIKPSSHAKWTASRLREEEQRREA